LEKKELIGKGIILIKEIDLVEKKLTCIKKAWTFRRERGS